MKRVCHITSAHPPGDIRIFHKECLALARTGYEVTLLVNNGRNLTREGVRIISVLSFRSRWWRMLFSPWVMYFYALRCRAVLYHLHDPELLVTGLLLKISGKKVVYDAHEDTSLQVRSKYYLKPFLRRVVSRVIRKTEDLSSVAFDAIVAASAGVRENFPVKTQPSVTLVRNYPDLREFPRRDMGGDQQAKETPHTICYIGAISESRGLHNLLSSLDHHTARLEMAGPCYPPALADEIRRRDPDPRILYHGMLGRRGVQKVLQRSSVGLVVLPPSDNHLIALPLKMFEYMAAGLPVIASDFPLWRQIVEENGCGYCIEPGNAVLLGATVEYLLRRDELRAEMGANGRRAVEKFYNWADEEKRLLQLYENITG